MGDLLRESLDHVATIVGDIRPDRLGDPTPCEAWDVKTLLNHLVASNRYFAASALGEQPDRGVYDADHLGDDPEGAYRRSAADAVEAWGQPGAMDGTAASGMPARALWAIHLAEVLTHGWDLAHATDQDPALPAAACEAALETLRTFPPETIRQPGVFGHEVAVGPDAPAHDRLAAFLGRQAG